MHSRSSLENHSQFQTKSAKSIPVFRPKRRKNYPHWGGTYLVAYMREYPSGLHSTRHNTNLPSNLKNVALAYEPSVEKNRVSYISKNDPSYGRLYRSLDRDWRSDAPYLPVGSTAASSKRWFIEERNAWLEHHLNSALNLVACVTGAGWFISLVL